MSYFNNDHLKINNIIIDFEENMNKISIFSKALSSIESLEEFIDARAQLNNSLIEIENDTITLINTLKIIQYNNRKLYDDYSLLQNDYEEQDAKLKMIINENQLLLNKNQELNDKINYLINNIYNNENLIEGNKTKNNLEEFHSKKNINVTNGKKKNKNSNNISNLKYNSSTNNKKNKFLTNNKEEKSNKIIKEKKFNKSNNNKIHKMSKVIKNNKSNKNIIDNKENKDNKDIGYKNNITQNHEITNKINKDLNKTNIIYSKKNDNNIFSNNNDNSFISANDKKVNKTINNINTMNYVFNDDSEENDDKNKSGKNDSTYIKTKIDKVEKIISIIYKDNNLYSILKRKYGEDLNNQILNEEVTSEFLDMILNDISSYFSLKNNKSNEQFVKNKSSNIDQFILGLKDNNKVEDRTGRKTVDNNKNNSIFIFNNDNDDNSHNLTNYFLFNLHREKMIDSQQKKFKTKPKTPKH